MGNIDPERYTGAIADNNVRSVSTHWDGTLTTDPTSFSMTTDCTVAPILQFPPHHLLSPNRKQRARRQSLREGASDESWHQRREAVQKRKKTQCWLRSHRKLQRTTVLGV